MLFWRADLYIHLNHLFRYQRLSWSTMSEQWNMFRPRQRIPMWLCCRLQRNPLRKQCVTLHFLFLKSFKRFFWISCALWGDKEKWINFQLYVHWDIVKLSFCCSPVSSWKAYYFSDIDDCQSQPCHNNGICEDLVNDYQCNCTAGFTGAICDIGMESPLFIFPLEINFDCLKYLLLLLFLSKSPIYIS